MDQYKQDMKQNYAWQQFYQQGIQDTGVTSPEGHSVLAQPQPPYILRASAAQEGVAPVTNNPAAMLYSSGNQNLVLNASGDSGCESGCVQEVHKPDPRVRQVKPLYQPHVFKGTSGSTLPTVYNVVGMY